MEMLEILLLAIGVSMDAFAVSICKGITVKEKVNRSSLIIGTYFGVFQGIMPLIGYLCMGLVDQYIFGIKEFIVFGLLVYIGVMMIIDSNKKEEFDSSLKFKEMLVLSIATSLDALSIGATLSLSETNILISVITIAFTTFAFCFMGVKIGHKFGDKYKSKAEILGGIILMLIGVKVLLEYLITI